MAPKSLSVIDVFEKVVQANGLVWSLDVLGLPVVTVPADVMAAKMKIDWSFRPAVTPRHVLHFSEKQKTRYGLPFTHCEARPFEFFQ